MPFCKHLILLLIVVVAVVTAEPPPRFRSRNSRLQLRRPRPFFARQESVPSQPQPDAAPYATADELKPENPFQGEEETVAAEPAPVSEPELLYGPPDSIYGPPLPETDSLPVADAPLEFASNPNAEVFARLTVSRPARLHQRPTQQRTQLHLVQRPLRLQQQRRQQQRATIRQIVNLPPQRVQHRAIIQQVVSAPQRLQTQPAAAAAVIVSAPSTPIVTPAKVVINSERLVVGETAPTFNAAIDLPSGESYVVVNSPFTLGEQYQAW